MFAINVSMPPHDGCRILRSFDLGIANFEVLSVTKINIHNQPKYKPTSCLHHIFFLRQDRIQLFQGLNYMKKY